MNYGFKIDFTGLRNLGKHIDMSHLELCSLGNLIFMLGQNICFSSSVFVDFEIRVGIC